MTYSLTWLADVLRAAGLKVVEQPGWKSRGRREAGKIVGVLCHHTAGPLHGNAPSLDIVTKGRPNLKGPLAHLVLGRDGTYYVIAAGACNHAGGGNWHGCRDANRNMIGIEAENTGLANDNPWPAVQMDAYTRGVAAILKHIGADVSMCAGHLEYALPVGRKSDPSFSIGSREQRIRAMDDFRAHVAAIMHGLVPATAAEDDGPGDAGDDDSGDEAAIIARPPVPLYKAEIETAQRALKAMKYHEVGAADGKIGSRTIAAVAAFMHDQDMPGAPVLDYAMKVAICEAENRGFTRPIPAERAEGEPEGSRIVAGAERQGAVGIIGTVTGGGGFLAWIMRKVDVAQGYVDQFGAMLTPIAKLAGEFWWIPALGLCAYVAWEAAQIRAARVEDHREGVST